MEVFRESNLIGEARRLVEAQPLDEERLAADRGEAFSSRRRTIAREVSITDIGTFQGAVRQTITFAPSERHGWWIRREDHPEQLDTLVDIANLWSSVRNLVLRSGSEHNYLRMVEHIIALKAGLGIDDLLIKVRSGDPPLFDDSSLPLVKLLLEAGIVEKDEPASAVTVTEPLLFKGNRGDFLVMLPLAAGERNLRIDCAIKWNTCIGEQRVRFDVTAETFRYASYARTNCTRSQYFLARTVGKLVAATRNWGYNRRNILIHGQQGYQNEPRFPVGDKFLEPVWHRATLDLMAALSLTGVDRFLGTVYSYRAGHTLDCDAVRALYRNGWLRKCSD